MGKRCGIRIFVWVLGVLSVTQGNSWWSFWALLKKREINWALFSSKGSLENGLWTWSRGISCTNTPPALPLQQSSQGRALMRERDADRMPNPNPLELRRKEEQGANLYLGPAAKAHAFVKSEQNPLIQTSPLFRDSKLKWEHIGFTLGWNTASHLWFLRSDNFSWGGARGQQQIPHVWFRQTNQKA